MKLFTCFIAAGLLLCTSVCSAVELDNELHIPADIREMKDDTAYKASMSTLDEADGYYRDFEYDLAIKAYHKALKIDPNSRFVYNKLASIYLIKGKYNKALECINESLARRIEKKADYFTRAEIYIALEEYAKARADIERGLQAAPLQTSSDRLGYKILGRLYRKQGRTNMAIKAYSEAIDIAEERPISKWRRVIPLDDYFIRAQLYEKTGDADKAIADYKKIISYQRQSVYLQLAYFMLGKMYYNEKCYTEAEAAFAELAKLPQPGGFEKLLETTEYKTLEEWQKAVKEHMG